MSAASVAVKLARRGTALSLRHALLIVLIIALPVAGLSAFVLRFQSQIPTTQETVTSELGHTQSVLTAVRSPDPTARQDGLNTYGLSGGSDQQGNPLHPDTGRLVDPRTVLPAGTRVLAVADSTAEVKTATATITLPVTLGPTADPSFRGRFDLVAGRAPRTASEITATQAALDRLGSGIGARVQLTDPVAKSFTVVGVLADHRHPSSTATLFLPAGVYDGTTAAPGLRDQQFFLPSLDVTPAQTTRLNHEGITVWSRALVASFGPPENQWTLNVGLYLGEYGFVAALAAFIIALLAGSAFSIGAKSRQRGLAMIAATGGSRRFVFGLMISTGAIVGAVAGAAGVGLGIAAGSAWMALTNDGTIDHYAGFHLLWWEQLIVFLYAVLVGMIAAAMPAIGASRLDTVLALRGARKPAPPSRRRPVVGIVMVAAGVALSIVCGIASAYLFTLSAGPVSYGPGSHQSWVAQHAVRLAQASGYGLAAGIILTQLGLLLCAALVVRVAARVIGRAGMSARLAGRDLARNHARTVPAIAAIMATSFLAVFAVSLLVSQSATDVASYMYQLQPGQLFVPASFRSGTSPSAASVRAAISDSVGGTQATTVSGAAMPPAPAPQDDTTLYADVVVPRAERCPTERDGQPADVSFNAKDLRCRDPYANGVDWSGDIPRIVVGDASALAAVIGHAPTQAAQQELAYGGAVALHSQLVEHGTLTIGWFGADRFVGLENTGSPERSTTAVDAVYESPGRALDVMAVLSPAAAAKAGIHAVPMGTFALPRSLPTQAQLDALNGALQRLSGDSEESAQLESGPTPSAEPLIIWGALGGSSFLALCAAGVALALARSDGRRDVEVLDAVGAAPGIRRRYAAWQAVMITGVGMLLGALTGAIGAFAIDGTSRTSLFVMPWGEVAVAVIGTTLVIAAASWLTGGRLRGPSLRSAIA